jgi:hypothetical protein
MVIGRALTRELGELTANLELKVEHFPDEAAGAAKAE